MPSLGTSRLVCQRAQRRFALGIRHPPPRPNARNVPSSSAYWLPALLSSPLKVWVCLSHTTRTHAHTNTRAHAQEYNHTYTDCGVPYTCVARYTHTNTRTYAQTHTNTRTQTHVHAHAHAHTHIHTQNTPHTKYFSFSPLPDSTSPSLFSPLSYRATDKEHCTISKNVTKMLCAPLV